MLLNAPMPLKHVPLRIYIPTSAPPAESNDNAAPATVTPSAPGSYKMMQALVPPRIGNRGFSVLDEC